MKSLILNWMKKVIGLLIILGSITWSLTMVKSGWLYDYGYGFWGANGHDGVWHIALANNLARLSLENPVFAGENIKNYHMGFDILLALINRITGISVNALYFQIFPPLFAIAIGLLIYWFITLVTNSKKTALISVFFVYFAGSLGFLVGTGESAFWSQQAISTLINPPFALSLIFILSGLIAMQKKKLILSILFFGVLIQIKVYAGLLVLGGLFVCFLFELISKRQTLISKTFLGTLTLSLLLFLPFNKNPQGLIHWQPFWFLETMMSYSDRLGWSRFYSAMTTYKIGHVWFKGILAYGVAFLVFIIGNFWTRLIFLKDIFKKLDTIKVFMLSIIFAGVVIPLFFVQSGTPWNTIQFMYYSLFFSGLLTCITLGSMTTNKSLIIFFILLTIPTTYMTLKDVYIPNRPPAKLSNYEIEALNYLKSLPSGIVLTYPYDADKAKEAVSNPPRPLYLYESTAYVSAYANKTVFLGDEVNLNIMGYDWKGRREDVIDWYKQADQKSAREFLDKNNISYIYWVKPQRALLGESQLGLVEIFNNKEVIIYKSRK